MNSEKKDILYRKVKYFIKNRRKTLRFSLPTKLKRSADLVESLQTIEQNNFQEYEPVESPVWLERYDQEMPVDILSVNEGDFWKFLYSDTWSECSSSRVAEGPLLTLLNEALFSLVKKEKVLTYTTAGYERNTWIEPLSCMKDSTDKREKTVEEDMKITFTYYGTSEAGLQRALSHYGHVSSAISILKSAPVKQKQANVRERAPPNESEKCLDSAGEFPDSTAEIAAAEKSLDRHDSRADGRDKSSEGPGQSGSKIDDVRVKDSAAQHGGETTGDMNVAMVNEQTPTPQASASQIISPSPIFVKSLGIVEPPIDILSQNVHFDDDRAQSDESLSESSSEDDDDENGSSTQTSGSVDTEKTRVEIVLDEFKKKYKKRQRDHSKKTALEILRKRAWRKMRPSSVSDAGDDSISEAAPQKRRSDLKKSNKINRQTLNLRYSIDKLFDFKRQNTGTAPGGQDGSSAGPSAPGQESGGCRMQTQEGNILQAPSTGKLSVCFYRCVKESSDSSTALSDARQPIFARRNLDNFEERCLKAIDDFVVRKEQITSSRGFHTVTTVTFNKIVPIRY